jgi:hypothetical protein
MRRVVQGATNSYVIFPDGEKRADEFIQTFGSRGVADAFVRDLMSPLNMPLLRAAVDEATRQSHTDAAVIGALGAAFASGALRAARVIGEDAVPVLNYMVGEMNTNAGGLDAHRIRELNNYSATVCISQWSGLPWWQQLLSAGVTPDQCVQTEMSSHAAATLAWALNVRQDGIWDHKPIISARFQSRQPGRAQFWHRLGPSDYFYDIWSNLHYGYVGAACGFSDSALLDGAGLEQIGSDLFRGNLPRSSPGVSGLRRFDDPSDREGIRLGIRLFRTNPRGVTAAQVRAMIVGSTLLTKRATTVN